MLRPRPEIILIGNGQGTADICREFNLCCNPLVECNEYGTPMVRSVFQIGQSRALHPVCAYVNADIILLNDFIDAIVRVRSVLGEKDFLLFGGRWNVKNIEPVFSDVDWQSKAGAYVREFGWFDGKIAMDYFAFPSHMDWAIPDFFLGRGSWDSWFPYRARKTGVPVIDVSACVTAIHQDHDYLHFTTIQTLSIKNPEIRHNISILGFGRRYTIGDRTHKLIFNGLVNDTSSTRFLIERMKEAESWFARCMQSAYPYSYPLYVILRAAKRSAMATFGWFRNLVYR
jgi:hypothetical protein